MHRSLLLVGASWAVRAALLLSLVLTRPLVLRSIGMSSKVLAFLGVCEPIGATAGCIGSGFLVDAVGPKSAMLLSMFVSLLALYGTSLAQNHVHLFIGHILIGIGAGGEVPATIALGFELAPGKSDGMRNVALLGVFAAAGGVAAIVCSPYVTDSVRWNVLYRVGAAIGILLEVVMTCCLPKSSSFQTGLCGKDSKCEVKSTLPVINTHQAENKALLLGKHSSRYHSSKLMRWVALWVALSMASYVFTIHIPTVLSLEAFSVFASWQPMVATRITEAIGALVAAVVVTQQGPRHSLVMLISLMIAISISLVVTVTWMSASPGRSWRSASPVIVTLGASAVSGCTAASWSCASAVFGADLPTHWRGRGIGLAFAAANAASAGGSYLYPYIHNYLRWSLLLTTLVFGSIAYCTAVSAIRVEEDHRIERRSPRPIKSDKRSSFEDYDDEFDAAAVTRRADPTVLTQRLVDKAV